MIIRQLKQNQFDSLRKDLLNKAHAEPLDASYTVNMAVSGVEYALKIQPEPHCKMAILQAHQIDRNKAAPRFELITGGNILSSLLEILIHQGIR